MSAGKYDLYIEQGATFYRECTYKDQTGVPINLTGMSLSAQIRRSYSDPTITQTIGVSILDQSIPANVGKFVMSISSANTALIPVSTAVDYQNTPTMFTWDIELNTGSTVRRLMQGSVYVSPEVTK